MNIQNHIKNLLFRHDCVMVKGLGGFVCLHLSSRFEKDYLLPPSKKLSFNPNLNHGDGLLENHIAKVEKVSYQIAQQRVLAFSKKILHTLEQDKEVHLKDIGSLKLNKDNKILFEPALQSNFHIEAYGLPKCTLQKITTEVQQPEQNTVITIPQQPEKKQRTYWRYAAVGILTIGIASLIGTHRYKNNVEAYNLAQREKATQIVNDKIQQSTFVITEPLQTLSIELKPKKLGKYHIIAGAFKVKENVDKKIKQLQALGFNAKYIGMNPYGLHQVTFDTYDNKKQALQKLKEIQAKINPYAWLFVKEL